MPSEEKLSLLVLSLLKGIHKKHGHIFIISSRTYNLLDQETQAQSSMLTRGYSKAMWMYSRSLKKSKRWVDANCGTRGLRTYGMSRTVMQIFYVWISNLVSISTLNSQILASSISLEIQRNVNWNRTRWPITRSHYDEILPHCF